MVGVAVGLGVGVGGSAVAVAVGARGMLGNAHAEMQLTRHSNIKPLKMDILGKQ
jgi:hypothetical protein